MEDILKHLDGRKVAATLVRLVDAAAQYGPTPWLAGEDEMFIDALRESLGMPRRGRGGRVVRVVLPDGVNEMTPDVGRILEALRYAGSVKVRRMTDDGVCFDVLPPAGVDEREWAKMNAERMTTLGYNAVSAPAVA